MSFESAAIQSVKANRVLQKRESLFFDRNRIGSAIKPATRAARKLCSNGKPYRLAAETDNSHLYPILGIVSLLIAVGIVLTSIWSNTIS